MKAIQTRWGGYRFRSRVEARWGIFFEHLLVPWEYEKEGFTLPAGLYLPDFFLPEQNCWVEIKGQNPTVEERALCSQLACHQNQRVYLFAGRLFLPGTGPLSGGLAPSAIAFYPNGDVDDGEHHWCDCEICGACGIEFQGRSHNLPCRGMCLRDGHQYKGRRYDSTRVMDAYRAALSARFEHGEKGAA